MRSSLLLPCFVLVPLATACGMFTGVDSDGLVGSGPTADGGADDGDSGRRDAGSSHRDSGGGGGDGSGGGGGGTADSGGGGSLGPQCSKLQDCCSTLDPSIASSCDDAVLEGVESSCASTLSSYKSDGYCGGTVTPPPVDAGTTIADPCSSLLTCCLATGTTSADPNCLTTALGSVASACLTEYNEDVALGICN